MDLPDNILDDFDFNNDDNDEEVITSCNKVRNSTETFAILHTFLFPFSKPQMKYSISELDNVTLAMAPNENRRSKRGSFIRHNTKNTLSLSTQVIPEISHENASVDEEKVVLNNGHDPECNINRHLRFEHENNSTAQQQPKLPTNRVISVIEEASV